MILEHFTAGSMDGIINPEKYVINSGYVVTEEKCILQISGNTIQGDWEQGESVNKFCCKLLTIRL